MNVRTTLAKPFKIQTLEPRQCKRAKAVGPEFAIDPNEETKVWKTLPPV
jgi:hypothetical protein